jgi:hypothetical protein
VRRRLLRSDPEEVWRQIEDEFGPIYKIADDDLKQILETELVVAELDGRPALHVPAEVAERVFEALIDTCRRATRSFGDPEGRALRVMLTRAKKGVPSLKQLRPSQAPNRPKDSGWYIRHKRAARHELRLRKRALMRKTGLSSSDALERAAEEIAPGYNVKPSTLLTWFGHADLGRRRKARK